MPAGAAAAALPHRRCGSFNMSAPISAKVVGLVLLSAAAGFPQARAQGPAQAQGAQRLMQLAQRDAAYCRNWSSQIQSMRNNYSSQCSGSLAPNQVARCNSMRQQLQDEIQRYNSQCG
jgi:hypothetical protein